jgi:hypothetical protein
LSCNEKNFIERQERLNKLDSQEKTHLGEARSGPEPEHSLGKEVTSEVIEMSLTESSVKFQDGQVVGLKIGEKDFPARSFSDVLKSVLLHFYRIDGDLLERVSSNLPYKRPLLDKNQEKFVRPFEIDRGLFIETNLSASAIVKRLQTVKSYFPSEGSEILLYVSFKKLF